MPYVFHKPALVNDQLNLFTVAGLSGPRQPLVSLILFCLLVVLVKTFVFKI